MEKVDEHMHRAAEGFPCPSCGSVLDAASGPNGAVPRPGDFSICAYCGVTLRFEDPLPQTRLATDEDLAELDDEGRKGMEQARSLVEDMRAVRAIKDTFMKHFGTE